MSSVNKTILIGLLGKDPEIRTTQNGKEIASFSLATSESWKNKTTGQKETKTEWHQISIFSPGLVNVVKQYLKKGSKIYIEGKLETTNYTDKNDIERYTTKIVLQGFGSQLIMLARIHGDLGNNADFK